MTEQELLAKFYEDISTPEIIVDDDGNTHWFLKGKRHREDGPAVIGANGSKVWCLNDQFHREDGPALVRAFGEMEWYLNGERLTEEQFNDRTRTNR